MQGARPLDGARGTTTKTPHEESTRDEVLNMPWLQDVRKKIQREVFKKQTPAAKQSSNTRMKVSAILQMRARRAEPVSRFKTYSPDLMPFSESSLSEMLSPQHRSSPLESEGVAGGYKRRHNDKQHHHHRTTGDSAQQITAHLCDKLTKEIAKQGMPALTRDIVVSYCQANPDLIVVQVAKARQERRAQRHQRRLDRAKQSHKHVFQQEVLLGGSKPNFPRSLIKQSEHDVCTTRIGNVATILNTSEEMRQQPVRSLPSIAVVPPLLSGFSASAPTTTTLQQQETLGSQLLSSNSSFGSTALHQQQSASCFSPFPRLELESGRVIEFDSAVVSTLALNNYALMRQIAEQQCHTLGKVMLAEDAEVEMALVASNTPTVVPQHATELHDPDESLTTTLNRSLSKSNIMSVIRAFSVPALSEEELSLLSTTNSSSPAQHHRATQQQSQHATMASQLTVSAEQHGNEENGHEEAMDDENKNNNNNDTSESRSGGGTGLIFSLIRDVDSATDSSEESDFEPLCIVCQARNTTKKGRKGLEVDDSELVHSSKRAEETLSRWKATHRFAQLSRARQLTEKLEQRISANSDVKKSLFSLSEMTAKANSDALCWKTSRAERRAKSPTEQRSIWASPSDKLRRNAHNWEMCDLLWRRLAHFVSLLSLPNNDEQVQALENLRRLLVHVQMVSKSIVFRWLHCCGPTLLKGRDLYRLFTFVRLMLDVPLSAVHHWTRLHLPRHAGFEIVF